MTNDPRVDWERALDALAQGTGELSDAAPDESPLSPDELFDIVLNEMSDEALLVFLDSLPSVSRTEREQTQFLDRLRVAAALQQTLPTSSAACAPGGRVFKELREQAGFALDAWAGLLDALPEQWERVEAGRRLWMLLPPETVEKVAELAGWPLRTLLRLLEQAQDVELTAWRRRFRTPQVSPLYRHAVVRESTPPPVQSLDATTDPITGIERQYADFFAAMRRDA